MFGKSTKKPAAARNMLKCRKLQQNHWFQTRHICQKTATKIIIKRALKSGVQMT